MLFATPWKFYRQSFRIEDLTNLGWDYDRMSTSGQQTYDRLSRMYAMKFEEKRNASV